jgi:Flp pilus assembly protein TadD
VLRDLLTARFALVVGAMIAMVLASPTAVPEALTGPVRQAEAALAAGQGEAALGELEAALAFEPDYAALHALAAQAALAAGQPGSALDHLLAAEVSLPPDSLRLCQQGLALAMLGDTQGALGSWMAGGETCESLPDVQRTRAELALGSDDREGALVALRRLTALEPANPEPRLRLGLTAATLDPESAIDTLRLADELTAGGSPAAQAVIRAIEQASSEDDPAYTLAAVGQALGAIGEWRLAAWAFRDALTIDPQYALARAYLGLALDQMGGDGLAELRTAAALSPSDPLPRFFLGLHWRIRGDPTAAVEALTAAADLDPANPSISAELGGAYEDLGNMTSALEAFFHAAELAPRESGFWRLLAEFSLRNEIRVREVGIPAARNAYSLIPDDPTACDNLGYAYYLAGDLTLAERFLRRAVGLDSGRPATQFHLGLLLLRLEKPAAARAAFATAARLDPEGPIGALARRTLEGLR